MGQILEALVDGVSIDRRLLDDGDQVVVSTRDFSRVPESALGTALDDLGPGLLVTSPVDLDAADDDEVVLATITPGFHGRIVAAFAIVVDDGAGAGADVTVQTEIEETPTLGGAIHLTIDNTDTAGTVRGGTRVHPKAGSNPPDFEAGDEITFVVDGTPTVFTGGSVVFGVLVAPRRKPGPQLI